MSIRVTLRELLEAQPALQRLSNEKLPVKVAYNVARMMRVVQPEVEDFYKQRNALVKEYGVTRAATEAERSMHGDEVTEVPKDKLDTFREEIDGLAQEVVVLEREPLKITDSFPAITAADLLALGPLVDLGDDANPNDNPPAPPLLPSLPGPPPARPGTPQNP